MAKNERLNSHAPRKTLERACQDPSKKIDS